MYSNIVLSAVLLTCVAAYERTFNVCNDFKLQNGRMRIKPKGKLAKFQCNRGYMLAGEKYSYCIKGKFDVPPPVCVKPTCTKIKQFTNGLILPAYNGGVMNFYCKPGFTMRGSNISYCDGVRWSHNLPACISTHIPTPTSCDFETEDLCGWSHDLNHDFDWRRQNFQTPSGHIGTGPRYDHTKGEAKDGYYMYIESTSRLQNDTARLISPVYPPYRLGLCLTFWYHMYGKDMGRLNVYVRGASQPGAWGANTRGLTPLWTRQGNLGDAWRRGRVVVEDGVAEEFQIIIEGIRGSTYVSDLAIDDVELTETCADGDDMYSTTSESSTDEYLDINYGSCENRCNETGAEIILGDAGSCECNENCYFRNTCCPDYKIVCLEVSFDEYSTEYTENYDFTSESNTSPIMPDFEITTRNTPEQITKSTTDVPSTEIHNIQQITTTVAESTTKPVVNTGRTTKIDKPNGDIEIETSSTKSSRLTTSVPITTKITTTSTQKINIIIPTKPTGKPTVKSTGKPTVIPTVKPTVTPTVKPAVKPTVTPTVNSTVKSAVKPAVKPTNKPTPKINKDINNIDKPNTAINKNISTSDTKSSKQIPSKVSSTSSTTNLAPTTPKATEIDFQQPTLEIETDFEASTTRTILENPKMEMQKDKTATQEESGSNLTFVIIGTGSVVLICIIVAVGIFVKFNARCHNMRLRNHRNNDSMSDVRFLASDEVLDFTWKTSSDM